MVSTYYMRLVEHFWRMAVRYDKVTSETRSDWFQFTKAWIDLQSEGDKELIRFVFSSRFFRTIEGLYCYKSDVPMHKKKERLAALERQFAIDGGLIGDENENN